MTTEYSIQKMVSDGTLSTIALGIQYLQRNDIYVRIAGVETPHSGAPSGYTWSFLDNTTLKILPVVPNGVEVVVYRRTDVDAMYNIYSQNAQFDEATIDENNQQLLYIAQEYLEQGIPGAGVDTIEFVRDDGTYTYYRIKRTDGSYSDEFAVPSAGSATKILAREALRRSYAEAGYNLVDGSFEAGGTLTNANDVLLHESTGRAFSGSAGSVVAGTDHTTGGFVDRSNAISKTYRTVSDMIAAGSQHVAGQVVRWLGYYEESDGGSNWGIVKSGVHVADGGSIFSISPTLYVEANLKGKRVNVRKFGARGVANVPVYDCITQIRACEAYVRAVPDPNLQQTMYFPCGKYGISDTWHIDDTLEFEIYCDNVHFTSMATTAKGAMILCTDWVLSAIKGKVRFDNTTNPAFAKFDTGLSVQAATKGNNKNAFYNVTSTYFRAGLVVGDAAIDLQCSENMFYNYNTFECPVAVDGGGRETGAVFIGGNIHGTPHVNLPGAPIHALWVKGGFWSLSGAELLTTQSASNQCIRMNPDKGARPTYPQVRVSGGVMETASPLLLIDNPDGVVLDRSKQPGQFSIEGTGGYCGSTAVVNHNFIEAADDFYGKIQVRNNNFYAVATRNAFNISAGPVAEVETDSTSWGLNFRDWIGGCNGGILRHDDVLGAVAYNSAGATYLAGVKQTIKLATKSPLPRYQRYNANFNLATGLYTVPQGGHSSLKVDCSILASGLNGDFFVEVDGVIVQFGQIVGITATVSATVENLVGGQTVGVYLKLASGSLTLTNGRFNNINFTISN